MALANLATDTQVNRALVALLTKTISELLIQVATLTTKLVTAQSETAWLKNWDIVHPLLSTAIGRPAIRPYQSQTQTKTAIYTPIPVNNPKR